MVNLIRNYTSKISINNYLKLAFFLGIFQFIIYFSGFDYLLRLGPFVTHHFFELPAFHFFGYGLSICFKEMELSSQQSNGINIILFVLTILPFYGGNITTMKASFIVSTPWLVGFYYHRMFCTE